MGLAGVFSRPFSFSFRLLFVVSVLALTGNSTLFSEDEHAEPDINPSGSHPLAESIVPFESTQVTTLKAEDILSGIWKQDENGACDMQKGCPYRNIRGEIAYLPLIEKKRLEQLVASNSRGPVAKPQVVHNNRIEEISSEKDLEGAFAKSADKDVMVVLFGAENCGPCKTLQGQITRRKDPNLGVFLAERPDWARLSGNPLHIKFRNDIGNGVPVAFIYTKDDQGNWKRVVVKQSSHNSIMGAIDSALATKRAVATEKQPSPRQAAQVPVSRNQETEQQPAPRQAAQAPVSRNQGEEVSLEFTKKPDGGLMVQESGQTEPEQVYLLQRGVNDRVAAFKNPDGTFRVAPPQIQEGVRKYYQEQSSKIPRLPQETQKHLKQFMDSAQGQSPTPIAFQTAPRPTPAGGSSAKFEAGRGKNPGFPFDVILGNGISVDCQATLISASGGVCMAAAAEHCLNDLSSGTGAATCPLTGRDFAFKKATAMIEMPNFGRVQAQVYMNPLSNESLRGANHDTAVFSWPCPQGPGNVPVIPISDTTLSHGEPVLYGKVKGGKAGLYPGVVDRPNPNIFTANIRLGEAKDRVVQPGGVEIQKGDSGGGLFRKLADGSLELVGILSSVSHDGTPNGNYATNRSLDFIKCVKSSLGQIPLARR